MPSGSHHVVKKRSDGLMIQSSHYFYLRKHSAAIVQQDFFTFHVTWHNIRQTGNGYQTNYSQITSKILFISDKRTLCTVLTKLTKTISVTDVQKLKLCRDETLTRIFIKFRIVPLSSVTLQVLSGQSCTFVLWLYQSL